MSGKHSWGLALIAIAAITLALLPFASDLPDGLERVAEMFSFAQRERAIHDAPLRDYSLPCLSGFWGHAVAALVGIAVVAGLTFLIGKSFKRAGRE